MEKEKPKYGVIHERKAEVIEHVGSKAGALPYSWTPGYSKVRDETGATHHLEKLSYPVGTKGIIQYITTPSSGCWYFKVIDPNKT